MASTALISWQTIGAARLDELADIHLAVTRPQTRRWQTEQLNKSLLVALVAQFQKYCRDLHDAAVRVHVDHASPRQRALIQKMLIDGRRLDMANPRTTALGSDFGRLGIPLIGVMRARGSQTVEALHQLDVLIDYRNSIGHGDETKMSLIESAGTIGPTKASFSKFRRTLNTLAITMDDTVSENLAALLARPRPW